MNSTTVPMRKQRLNAMKQTRSMTAAAIIHSFIISWFLSASWRSWASLRSLVSSISIIDANRRSTRPRPCAPAADANGDDDDVGGGDDVRCLVSSKSRMLHSTSDVDLSLVSSFGSAHSTAPTLTLSICSKWRVWQFCLRWHAWTSSLCRSSSICGLAAVSGQRLLSSPYWAWFCGKGGGGALSRRSKASWPHM